MANQHTATSAITGQTFKRTSANRVYSHCVIVHFKGHTASDGRVWPPGVYAGTWASRADLAHKAASRWRGDARYEIEIVPTTVTVTGRRAA